MCISCDPQVTHMSPHVVICEARVGSHLLALRSHVKKTCEIGTTHVSRMGTHVGHMWATCGFNVIFS